MTNPGIVDTFGRKHTYLRISLTDRCNLRCFYCMPEEGIITTEKAHLMTLEEIEAIASEFVALGVDTIRLTGGEPLIRKNVEYLLTNLAKLPVRLKITTNGILLNQFFDLFETIGLRDLNISLDSLDKARSLFITRRDYFDRVMANLRESRNRGFHVKINVVVVRGVNDQEINDFIALTEHENLTVKFIEYMPFKGNKWSWEQGISEAEILEKVTGRYGTLLRLESPVSSTSTNYRVQGFQGSFGIVSTITNPFCSECNRIRLTADGKMKNCLFARKELDLLTAFRSGMDIRQLVLTGILEKKFSRDGIEVMTADQYEQNRSMIAIGG